MKKGFALPFILALIIIITATGYIVYKRTIETSQPINDISLPPPSDDRNKEATNSNNYGLSPFTQACINKLNTDIKDRKKGQEFVSGDVIVGFIKGVTEKEALEIIQKYNLKIKLYSPNPEQWGVVNVPKGKEIEWICKFEENKDIQFAELNGISRTMRE